MCGIAGALRLNGDAPLDASIVARLNDAQKSRGPDGAALWSSTDGHVVFGHRRLAVIDTSTGGVQPMSDASGRWTVTFNGEIYNYRLLRAELETLGRRFLTNSDTEVLINAVAQWGEAGLKKLRGMYAFALWDSHERELWLVRDPNGIKPLYVAQSAGTVWFASQARCLANCAPVDTRRDPAGVAGFYLWGFVPEPFSWWQGIHALPAGHVQRIRPGRAVTTPIAFQRMQDVFAAAAPQPLLDDELHALMRDTVQSHLVADVPVGVFLSAGVDSNAIAAIVAELGGDLSTVTLAFSEYAGTPNDEAPLAEAAAKALGSEHLTVRIGEDEFEEAVEHFLRSMDQPTIDGLNIYLVSRSAAAQGLKVAISGLGGDELFGGYPSFKHIPLILKLGRALPQRGPLAAVERAARALAPDLPPKLGGLLTHSRSVVRAYLLRRALHLEDELDALLDESWIKLGLQRLATEQALKTLIDDFPDTKLPYAQIAALESCWYMRNQLLRDTDWGSMAHGLEVRVPFVDVPLMQRLTQAIASDRPPTKRDLAAAAGAHVQSILTRPKTGFTTPVRSWIQKRTGLVEHRMHGWARYIHNRFRNEFWNYSTAS